MENIRNNELKLKRICRFCLTQDEPLTIIYSKENRVKSSVPLPLQIMACVSIEVFSNDGLPTTICESCRILMDHWYRFKQICKKADTLLKQYPLTGTWPSQLELPLLPAAIIKKNFSSTTNKRSASTVVSPPIPIKKQREEAIVSPSSPSKSVKLLNKSAPKILNKNVKAHDDPVLSDPIIKTDDSGNVEIITELLENVESYEEPDPIKFAPPVETNVFPCPNCERSFPLRQLLAIHMNNHTRERDFECAICSKRFFSKYDLGKHMLTHTGEKPYECVVCHRRFSRSTLLHRHEKIHTDQPKYLCVYCERPFLSREELDKHTEKHQKNRPFQCKVCDKSFAFKQGLERHEVVHSKNQPYPCEYCDKSFSTPSKLARHLTAHAGQRPFPCKLCPKSYLLSHHLTRHLRSHTNGTASYKCYDCGNLFNTRDDLIYHSAVHATQTLICPLCKEQFEDLDAVTEHIKSHTDGEQYACEFCDLIFTTEDRLDDHTGKDHYEDQLLYTQGPTANVKNEVHSDEDMEEYIIEEVGEEGGEVTYDIVGKEKKNVSNSTKDKTKIAKKISSTSPKTAIVKMQGTRKTLNLQSKSAPSEDNEEIEIRRSNRPSKVKDYAKLIKSEDDEGDEEEDLSFEDADYEAEEDQDDEEESLPLTRQSKTSKADKSRSTQLSKLKTEKPIQRSIPTSQQKLTKFLKTIEKPIEKSSVEKVLKNLPKAVTIIKKESGEKISNTDVPKKRETYGKIKQENDTAIKKSPKIEVVTTKYSPSTVTKSLIPQKTKVNETLKVNKPSTSVKNSGNETQKSSPISSTSLQVNERKADSGKGKLIEMVINNKVVKVQKIVMSKANIAAMAKEGKIKMKDGTMLLKKNVPSKNTKKISESSNVKD